MKWLTISRQLYSTARSEALQQLYRAKELDKDRSEDIEADFEEVAASCGHFSFSLQAFANEMQTYLTLLEELKEAHESSTRSWDWLKFWRSTRTKKIVSEEEEALIVDPNRETEIPKDLPDIVLDRRETKAWEGTKADQAARQGLYRRLLKLLRVLERDECERSFRLIPRTKS